VYDTWACNYHVDMPTTFQMPKGSLEMMIDHRFSTINNGVKDVFGIYGASNIFMALNYGVTDKIMLGFGSEKDNKLQVFSTKIKLLEQNQGGSIPVSLSLVANAGICTKDEELWGANYKFADRMSYFSQLLIARKFTDRISFQVGAGYAHFNKVENTQDELENNVGLYQNDAVCLSAGGRVKVHNELSVICEYNQGLYIKSPIQSYELDPKPGLSLGLEAGTSIHAFQFFVASARGLVPQQNFVKNQADFTNSTGLFVGFNITVRLK